MKAMLSVQLKCSWWRNEVLWWWSYRCHRSGLALTLYIRNWSNYFCPYYLALDHACGKFKQIVDAQKMKLTLLKEKCIHWQTFTVKKVRRNIISWWWSVFPCSRARWLYRQWTHGCLAFVAHEHRRHNVSLFTYTNRHFLADSSLTHSSVAPQSDMFNSYRSSVHE